MIWTLAGVALITYQLAAVASGRPRVSQLAHRRPFAPLIWGWWALLGAHFALEWLDDASSPRRSF